MNNKEHVEKVSNSLLFCDGWLLQPLWIVVVGWGDTSVKHSGQ